MKLKKNDKIVFFGDSITSAGRSKEEESLQLSPLGNGFVSLINSYLFLTHPELKLNIINKGIGGNRTKNLVDRIDRDVIELKPNWMIMMIGVNDAWHQNIPSSPNSFIQTNQEFEDNVRLLLSKAINNKINVVICSPFILELNHSDPIRNKLDEYNVILKDLAKELKLPYLDIQKAFDEYIVNVTSTNISSDRIHVSQVGHMLIAREIITFLK